MRPRATILVAMLGACASDPQAATNATNATTPSRPNVVLILADDLGYGDLGVYGSKTIATPNIDQLAADGARMTQAYSGNPVCTPSRAVFLTGRHGARQNLAGTVFGVYFPSSVEGMAAEQVTIAERLRDAGYATSLVGKWHLGSAAGFRPTEQGFQRVFGIPYSNDMAPLPLQEAKVGAELATIEDVTSLDKQAELTARYTAAIREHMRDAVAAEQPFFVYHSTHAPHIPLAPSAAFVGTNPSCDSLGVEQACGAYADQVSELDDSVGAILREIDELGVADNTLVIFTSDNGPWLVKERDGGSAGELRGGKGTTFEGGLRVPFIIRWPGKIAEGTVIDEPVVHYDVYPTVLAASGLALPADREIDGFDLGPLMAGEGGRDPSGAPFSYLSMRLDNQTPGAFRLGDHKLKFAVHENEAPYAPERHDELLFDLSSDPGEASDLSATTPELAKELHDQGRARLAEYLADPLR